MILSNCKIIGLTGGIATGKSTVSSILKDKGYIVIDADTIAREIVKVDKPAYGKIVEFFGESILNEDKTINRKQLGDIVFSDRDMLQALNHITHPYIFKDMKKALDKYGNNNILILDIPLLFEELKEINKYGILFDEIWLVYADEKTQIERLMKRDKFTKSQALNRIKAQMPIEDKVNQATRIIDNRGNIRKLEKNIERLLKDL